MGIQNIISNPTFYNMTQGTATQMGIKTGLNSVARPGFILMDGDINPHTKKFSASKRIFISGNKFGNVFGNHYSGFPKRCLLFSSKTF